VILKILIQDDEEHAQVVLEKVKCKKTTCNCISHLELVEKREKIKQGTKHMLNEIQKQETTKHKTYTLKFFQPHLMHLAYMGWMIDYQGFKTSVPDLCLNPQLCHNRLPVDGASVGAGSHNPS
jgi:hypothetical protein